MFTIVTETKIAEVIREAEIEARSISIREFNSFNPLAKELALATIEEERAALNRIDSKDGWETYRAAHIRIRNAEAAMSDHIRAGQQVELRKHLREFVPNYNATIIIEDLRGFDSVRSRSKQRRIYEIVTRLQSKGIAAIVGLQTGPETCIFSQAIAPDFTPDQIAEELSNLVHKAEGSAAQ
jgi:hypothetical protein